MELKHIEIKLARAATLPSLPHLTTQILRISNDINATPADYERILSQDAALASKVLRCANSPVYRTTDKEIATLNRAILQMGQQTIRSICLTIVLQSSFQIKGLDNRFNMKRFWSHCLAVACASKTLAHILHHSNVEEAFLAGLVHDIGKPALCLFLPSDAKRVYDIVEREHRPHYEVEQAILDITHQEIGLLAAQRWNLPESYYAAISQHHTPFAEGPNADPLAMLVHVGNALADDMGFAFSPSGECTQVSPEIVAMLGLPDEQYVVIMEAVRKAVYSLSAQLGL